MSQQPHNNKIATRLVSLDALRGFDMFWIICGEGIFHGLAKGVSARQHLYQNPDTWQITVPPDLNLAEKIVLGISNQLHHTPWNGFTFYDMIFPLFIFIAGVSMPFSFGQQLEKTGIDKAATKKIIYRSLIKRTLILLLLGMIVNGLLQFKGYENTRFASVLGRIALACFFAALIYLNCSLKKQLLWFGAILLGYFAAMMLIPVPGFGAGVLSAGGNLSGYIDRILLPGKLHRMVYDPEGLLSTIPAIASAMLGIFAGQFLRYVSPYWNPSKKAAAIAVAGLMLITTGLLWGIVFPVNKNMWTSSFVLLAGGWSALLFSFFYFLIDVKGYRKWPMPLVWIGMNSILIYVAAHGLVNFESTAQFIFGGLIGKVGNSWQPALLWTGVAVIQLSLLYFLYRKKWFLKI